MISESLHNRLRVTLELYEGRVNHLYVDTVGAVTVGIGHMIKSADAATKITMITNDSFEKASRGQIEGEYLRVLALYKNNEDINSRAAMEAKLSAKAYKLDSSLFVPGFVIDNLTDQHIASFYLELLVIFNQFDLYQDNVQAALFDMIFNLGATKLRRGFPKFCSFINAGMWQSASKECSRTGISDERNEHVRKLLWQ